MRFHIPTEFGKTIKLTHGWDLELNLSKLSRSFIKEIAIATNQKQKDINGVTKTIRVKSNSFLKLVRFKISLDQTIQVEILLKKDAFLKVDHTCFETEKEYSFLIPIADLNNIDFIYSNKFL